MSLIVQHGARSLTIEGRRGPRMVLTVLSLIAQVEATPKGKLTLSWGTADTGIAWSIESYGRDADFTGGIDSTSKL